MTTETNAERLKRIKSEWNGDDILCVADTDWLIKQAERVQELESNNARLLRAHELKDMEHGGLIQQLKEYRKENIRLREVLEELQREDSWETVDEARNIARQALAGDPDD